MTKKADETLTPAEEKAAAAAKRTPEVGEDNKKPVNRFDHKTKRVVALKDE